MRKLIGAIFLIAALTALFFGLHSFFYLKNSKWEPDLVTTRLLADLGDSALVALDVPVAAVLLYDGNVISTGYNTVRKDMLAGGHAEINAITNAIRKLQLDPFMKLDHDKLTLITTWEPCYMCQGAFAEYNISHVVILKRKSLPHWFKSWKKLQQYEWDKRAATTDTLQDFLFKKHPLYEQEKAKSDF